MALQSIDTPTRSRPIGSAKLATNPLASLFTTSWSGQVPRSFAPCQLCDTLLARYASQDLEDQRLALSALKILAVSRRSLGVRELTWAVALSLAMQSNQKGLTVAFMEQTVDYQRVMTLVQPFVTCVQVAHSADQQVSLLHESLKEQVDRNIDTKSPRRQVLTSQTTSSNRATHWRERTQRLECEMLDICLEYLLMENFQNQDVLADDFSILETLPQNADVFHDETDTASFDMTCTWEAWEADMIHYDPCERGAGELFVYAACQWLHHFSAVSDESALPDLRKIEQLCQRGSTRLNNWIAQNCRPGCTIMPRFADDSSLYDPLSIVSLYGSRAMLRRMLSVSDFDTQYYFPNTAFNAADHVLQWGDLSKLPLLFRSRVGAQIRNYAFFEMAVKQWARSPLDEQRQGWEGVFELVEEAIEEMIAEGWAGKLLSVAVKRGCTSLSQRLMELLDKVPELAAQLIEMSLLCPEQDVTVEDSG